MDKRHLKINKLIKFEPVEWIDLIHEIDHSLKSAKFWANKARREKDELLRVCHEGRHRFWGDRAAAMSDAAYRVSSSDAIREALDLLIRCPIKDD